MTFVKSFELIRQIVPLVTGIPAQVIDTGDAVATQAQPVPDAPMTSRPSFAGRPVCADSDIS